MIYAAVSWIGALAGLFLVIITLGSMINTMIVPRSISSTISYKTWRVTLGSFRSVGRFFPSYESKDRLFALLGPVSMLALLAVWLLLLLLGYGLVLWPLVGGNLGDAVRISGSSILTLGIAASAAGAPTAVIFISSATGLVTIALLIGYLPTIYSAYSRRETLVTMLESRAGEPAWGPEILARASFIEALDTAPGLYSNWEQWCADIAESHVNYPWLIFFRSPHPLRSWIVGLLAVLDSAALFLALAPTRAPSEARTCLRMGFTALRGIADMMQLEYDHDPQPDASLDLTYEEFLEAVDRVRLAGFPMERTAEAAWVHFRGWRVNYESIAYKIADIVIAVPALWSGPRTWVDIAPIPPKRPAQRTPEHPEGITVIRRERDA
jgi:hypothetical protein